MDRLAKQDPASATGFPEIQRFQFDYAIQHGLIRPSASFLDYGCGTAAPGLSFIEYFDEGKYVGADISTNCLNAAKRRIHDANLEGKRPELIHLPGGSLESLRGRRFDILWAQSVFTHMQPDDIRILIRAILRDHMHESSVFYATYVITDGPARRSNHLKDWYYHFSFFEEMAASEGFSVEQMPDWHHPEPADLSRLIKITPGSRSITPNL
jgi:ubiquinone/menaquinone biosynthesis C-methylase UbiE